MVAIAVIISITGPAQSASRPAVFASARKGRNRSPLTGSRPALATRPRQTPRRSLSSQRCDVELYVRWFSYCLWSMFRTVTKSKVPELAETIGANVSPRCAAGMSSAQAKAAPPAEPELASRDRDDDPQFRTAIVSPGEPFPRLRESSAHSHLSPRPPHRSEQKNRSPHPAPPCGRAGEG